MIITRKKPIKELLELLGGAKTAAILGCGSCATVCRTGGEAQVEELKMTLCEAGIAVVGTAVCDFCCMNLNVRTKMRALLAQKPDCVICMSCGDGVQCAAKNAPGVPTYPANDTLYLGEAVRFGVWEEACRFCGDCVLGKTGGICPVTHCAKSLRNGPCGGQKNGRCEVNPENECAWVRIYDRLSGLGQLDRLGTVRQERDHREQSHPRTTRLKEK